MILRPYQIKIIDDIRSVMPRLKTIVCQLCTGGGKTNLSAAMIKAAVEKGSLVFFLVHRRDLLFQTSNTFKDYGIAHSFIAAKHSYNPYAKVFICSIETLKRRLGKTPIPKIVFVDECHLAASKGWSEVIEFYRSRRCWIIGLSATPWRLDGKGLGDLFQSMVEGPSMRELINMGFLSNYKYFGPSRPDLSGLKSEQAREAAIERNNVLIGDAVEHYKKHAYGKKAVVYASSVEHSRKVVTEFLKAGIPAEHMDGETPDHERRAITKRFATGVTWVLSNRDLITTGYDLASQSGMNVTIECIILLRYTDSLSLYLQMVGRGLRPKDEPAIILDHAGLCLKADGSVHHGPPCMPREWSLEGEEKGAGSSSERTSPVKQCLGGFKTSDLAGERMPPCYFVHPPAPQCPQCGCYYEIKSREIEQIAGDLVELNREQIVKQKKMEQGMAEDLDSLIALGKKRGYKFPEKWAARVYSERMAKR